MEKLELKHLAPYLPYDLKIQGQTHGDVEELSMLSELSVYVKSQNSTSYGAWADIFDIKPLLRPMSEIQNQIDDLDTTYMAELWAMKTQQGSYCFDGYKIDDNTAVMTFGAWQHPNSETERKSYFEIDLEPEDVCFSLVTETIKNNEVIDESFYLLGNEFKMYQKLFEWHFDVFGLIEKGLAVSLTDALPSQKQ